MPAQKHHTEVVIVSTNDIHAAIDRMPALATLVERTRAVNPNVLVLDAGDKWTGNPYVDLNKEVGLPIVALLDSIGYDSFHGRQPMASITVWRCWGCVSVMPGSRLYWRM